MGLFGNHKSETKNADKEAAARQKEQKKARFTGRAMQPFGTIGDGALCKFLFNPEKQEMEIWNGKILEMVPYAHLRTFTVDSDVTVVKRGNGLGAAIVKKGMGEVGDHIVGQTVAMERKKIKWVAELVITDENGKEQSFCFAETAGAAGNYNKTTVKSYDTKNFENVFAEIVQENMK